jgi:FkbM family methyltransferase
VSALALRESKSGPSFFRRHLRRFVPFPRKATWLRWFPPFHERNIAYLIARHRIDLVLDVGAHEGGFGEQLRRCGYRGRIVSFEPVSELHAKLALTAKPDPAWRVAPPLALGATGGTAPINVHEESSISSFLPLERMPYADAAPTRIAPHRRETVQVARLDDIYDKYVPAGATALLKLDVQGFEDQVLAGATESLNRVAAVLIEVSLVPLYTGQKSYLEILGELRARGFNAAYFSSVHSRRRHGEEWEYNVFCVRNLPGAAEPRADRA